MKVLARVLLGLLLGLLVAEGVMRVYLEVLPDPADVSYIPDPQAGYKLRPQAAWEDTTDQHVNSLGYRDRAHPAAAVPGTRRVVGIGDSFVFGEVRLRDNFLRVAEEILNGRLEPGAAPPDPTRPIAASPSGGTAAPQPVEIFLMGLGGYSPENYVGVLHGTALSVGPDLILLCFFIGNDVTGIPTRSRVLHGELYATGSANPWLNALRKSRLFAYAERYGFFRLRASRLRAARSAATDASIDTGASAADGASTATRASAAAETAARDGSATDPARETPVTTSDPQNAGTGQGGLAGRYYDLVQRNRLPVFRRLPSDRMEALWREAERYLSEFDHTCRAAAVPWALVIIPDEVQVSPARRSALLRRLGEAESAYDFEEPQRRLQDFASRHSVPVLNLAPLLQEAEAEGERTYETDETHWNVQGNRIAGEALAEFVRQRLDSPRRPAGRGRIQVSETPN